MPDNAGLTESWIPHRKQNHPSGVPQFIVKQPLRHRRNFWSRIGVKIRFLMLMTAFRSRSHRVPQSGHVHPNKANVESTFVGASDWLRRHGEVLPLYLENGPGPPTGFPDMRVSPWYWFMFPLQFRVHGAAGAAGPASGKPHGASHLGVPPLALSVLIACRLSISAPPGASLGFPPGAPPTPGTRGRQAGSTGK